MISMKYLFSVRWEGQNLVEEKLRVENQNLDGNTKAWWKLCCDDQTMDHDLTSDFN